MIQKKIKGILAFVVAVAMFGCVGMFGQNAYADDKPEYQMSISPAKAAIEKLEPGETYTGQFEVKNTGAKEIDFVIMETPYSIKNEKYEPDFNATNAYTELNEWMTTTPSEGTIAPGESVEVQYVIEVPEDMHGGQQNAAIIVQATNTGESENGSAIQALNQLAFIIYSNVKGEVNEAGEILENKIPRFLLSPPVLVSSLVENTGNVYGEATYTLQVFPLFGDEEIYTNEDNPQTHIVFAGTKRYNEMEWEGAPQLGIYRLRQTIELFGETSVEEKVVFLCPIWFLFIILLVIFCAIFWIVSRVKQRKK